MHRRSASPVLLYSFRPKGGKESFCHFFRVPESSFFSSHCYAEVNIWIDSSLNFSLENGNEKNRSTEIVKILFSLILEFSS